jgi:N-hydroxyarylamine O-acetyltransferase
MISAKVFAGNGKYGEEYDHLAIIVRLNNLDYLVDVGFGKFAFEPLLIEFGKPQKDTFGLFQFDKFDADYFRVNEVVKGKLIPQYIFKLDAREFSEFEEMCHFHQTSSDSHFTRKKVISIVSSNGRITLDSEKLKITENGISKETVIKSEAQFQKFLKQYFDIKVRCTI